MAVLTVGKMAPAVATLRSQSVKAITRDGVKLWLKHSMKCNADC